MKPNVPMASCLRHSQHIVAITETVRQILADMEPLMVMPYMVDICDAKYLPILAAQFDVMGKKGWDLALTESAKRDLVKGAIELHSKKGTPYSIRRAFQSIGYDVINIIEGQAATQYDGSVLYNGTIQYDTGSTLWPLFSIILDVKLNGISTAKIEAMKQMIDIYKPARCKLVTFAATMAIGENITIAESYSINVINH